jgi:acetyl esterase/lipase
LKTQLTIISHSLMSAGDPSRTVPAFLEVFRAPGGRAADYNRWMSKTILCSRAFLFALALMWRQPGEAAQQATAALPQAQSGGASTTLIENVVYGNASGVVLHLDVYQPAGNGGGRPGVVLIHGGGWDSLDKSTMRGMGQFLARFGFVAFSADYRLLKGKENRWPAQLDDVQRAVRWVRANAAAYGVNPERIGAYGHSAGAQLAALLGMEETRDNSDAALAKYSSKVQAVVDVSGPTDFTADRNTDGAAFLENFLGAPYASDPGVWRDASPAFHISKDNAPFLIVHGTEDENVPIMQAQQFYEKMQAAGVVVKFIKVNAGHTFQTPEARRQLAVETLAFFQRYLAGS